MLRMSIDGLVLCDCLQAGLALPPPCPVEFVDVWVHPAPGFDDHESEIRQWSKTACPHPDFWLVEHQVIHSKVRAAMAEHGGPGTFPVIYAALPTCNGGRVDPTDAARCLTELDRLGALMSAGSMVAIVDADDDTVVFVDPDDRLVAWARHSEPWRFAPLRRAQSRTRHDRFARSTSDVYLAG
jgi:hypothetical protein